MTPSLQALISSSYGEAEAQRFQAFRPDQAAKEVLVQSGKYVLQSFPPGPGECALMSAMWTALIRDITDFPVHAVAGRLYVDGNVVFGGESDPNTAAQAFTGTNLDWDGHVWVAFGSIIADPSVFRTAYAERAPRILAKQVLDSFGPGRGLFAMPAETTKTFGFEYEQFFVLTDQQVSQLLRGAAKVIEEKTGEPWPPAKKS